MHSKKEGNRKLDLIKEVKLETEPAELCRDLPPCFLMAFEYIGKQPSPIDYRYLSGLFRKHNTIPLPQSLTQSFGSVHSESTALSAGTSHCTLPEAFTAGFLESMLQLGLKIAKNEQRRTSIESTSPSFLQVPSLTPELGSGYSQLVVDSIASTDNIGRLAESCNEDIAPEESVVSRMQAINRSSTASRFQCL